MKDTSIIIPIDLSQRPLDILRKASQLAELAQQEKTPLILAHNDHGESSDKALKNKLQGYSCTTLVSQQFYTGAVNPALLRNKAFEYVDTTYLVLLDVDIWPDFKLLGKYQSLVAAGKFPFYFLPCLYLTAKGSTDLCTGRVTPEALNQKYFAFSRKEFLHLASPSSITVMKSEDYLRIGMFDEAYSGHGYEDFDFMMRLAKHYEVLQPCNEMMNSKVARSPLFASGFRRALGRLSIDALLEKDFTYHLFHERPSVSAHKQKRNDNFARFVSRHQGDWGTATSRTLLEDFIEACRNGGRDLDEYSALFENKPGHIDRFDTFKRRLRFLLND